MLLAPTLLLNAGSGAAIARPTFSRDFAGEKTLNNGTGPAITFTRASNATFFDAAGTLQTAANDTPRFDHDPASAGNPSRGLLIEEARTNSIRNAQAGGAVVGTPGTLPTFWTTSDTAASGITREIVAVGTANGMSYVDFRFSGTATVAAAFNTRAEGTAQVVASAGQTWTASCYASLANGSTAGLSSVTVSVDERQTGGTIIASTVVTITSQLSSSLARYSATRTLGVSAGRVNPNITVNIASGATIDITLRIAAPQLEQGAFATSYIPTTNAAATRAADSAIVTPVSGFYNQAEGTLYAAFRPRTVTGTRTLLAFDNDTEDEQVRLRNVDTDPRLTVNDGGVEQANIDAGTVAAATDYRLAGAFKLDDFAASLNGASVATDTTGTMPTITHLRIGNSKAGNVYNGAIARIAYWPKRLSNTLLEQLTT
jgi:hypothetical protein